LFTQVIVTLRSATFICDDLKFGSKESVQKRCFVWMQFSRSLSCLNLFRSEWNGWGKKKDVYFILLDGSPVRKVLQRFLIILTWLLLYGLC